MEPLIITFPPHSSTSPAERLSQYHGYEFGLLLEGQLTLNLGFDSYELNAGDSLHFDAYRPHSYVNESDSPARGVWFVLRDELLRMHARIGSLAPAGGALRSSAALLSAWNAVNQTDW